MELAIYLSVFDSGVSGGVDNVPSKVQCYSASALALKMESNASSKKESLSARYSSKSHHFIHYRVVQSHPSLISVAFGSRECLLSMQTFRYQLKRLNLHLSAGLSGAGFPKLHGE